MNTFQETIRSLERRGVVLPDEYYSSLEPYYRSLSFSAAGIHTLAELELLKKSLARALANGSSFDDWRKEVQDSIDLPRYRLETIYRTNLALAYASGSWEEFRANSARRPFLMYSAILDARVRPSHALMDGYVASVDDPIWLTWSPPCGFNCRCTLISLDPRQAAEYHEADQRRIGSNAELRYQRAAALLQGPGATWVGGGVQNAHVAALRAALAPVAPAPLGAALQAQVQAVLDRLRDQRRGR